ncbi:MAG: CDP-paratose 2-epimerase [Verrucomicrobiae bacterium]|nr:CDP-paratose 2-epimerase [Verrucomicrobiae bacterium]
MVSADQAFAGRSVLITGGLGFIGSNLARRLADAGAQVTLLDSLLPQFGGNLFNLAGYEERVRVNIGDLRDEYSINHLVQGQDFIFNLAGQVSHLDSMHNPDADLEINCRSQLYLLEACRKHNPAARILYTSTRQVYGRPKFLPVTESHPLEPADINGIHKQAGEWYHVLYHRIYGLHTTSLRLTNTYGPRMRVVDARQTFLGLWLRQILNHEPLTIYGDGQQKRDFNYVDDVVEALLRVAVTPATEGQIYNLGATDPVSLLDLARQLLSFAGTGSYQLVPFPAERKPIDIGDYFADFTKIRTAIGWQPAVSLVEGLPRALDYYRVHHKHYW